ncbi:hypothetical protein BT69DRAFT_1355155 [Atractiella rhizophila]|nr:hypothetical protein BT69DRAFT_1355155 [Atractiella rhizophila]
MKMKSTTAFLSLSWLLFPTKVATARGLFLQPATFEQLDFENSLTPAGLGTLENIIETGTEACSPSNSLQSRCPPHQEIDLSQYTLRQILNYTLHHPESKLPIHKFASAANKTTEIENDDDSVVKWRSYWDYLENAEKSDARATILIPSDQHLNRRKKRKRHEGDFSGWDVDEETNPFEEAFEVFSDNLDSALDFDSDRTSSLHYNDESDTDLKQRILRLVVAVLSYHTLSIDANRMQLADLSTAPTFLPSSIREDDGKEVVGVPYRVTLPKFGLLKRVLVNYYASLVGPTIKAKNGYIHVLDAPLFPPPSALNTLLLFPQPYSTVTSSAFQVLARMHREHEHSYFTSLIDDYTQERVEKGRPKVYTAFPPTNKAFGKLGVKANIFLHSPLGIKILKKILAYHVVPHVIFHSDYVYNASSDFIVQPTSRHVDIDASSHWLRIC